MKSAQRLNLFLLLGLAVAVRLISLNQSYWLDEAISVIAVKGNSFMSLITRFAPGDVHPPLYYLVLWGWDRVFGYSEIASRLPSVIFGVIAVWLTYKIGSRQFSQRIGLLAGLLLALNPLSVYYSQEARMFALQAMLVSMTIYFLISKRWVWFGLSFLVAIYTDYFSLLMVPVFFVLSTNRKKVLKMICLDMVLFLPWVPTFFSQVQLGTKLASEVPDWGTVVGGISLKALPLTLVKFIVGRITIDNKVFYAVFFGGIGLVYLWILSRVKNLFLWVWLLAPLLLAFIISFRIPVYSYHRFIFVLPAFCLLLALGARSKFFLLAVVATSLLALAYFDLNPRFWREDWREAAAYFQSKPGLVAMPSKAQSAPLSYYAPQQVIEDTSDFRPAGERIYLLRYVQELFDPADTLRQKLLTAGYQKVSDKDFNGVLVWEYVKS